MYTIGDQIAEVLKVHNKGMSKQAIKDRSIELMRMVVSLRRLTARVPSRTSSPVVCVSAS